MNSGMSRRDLALLAGGSMLLGSCQSRRPTQEELDEHCERGYGKDWGADPHLAPQYTNGQSAPDYDPKYICIAIVDFAQPWTIDVHHASFPTNPLQLGDKEKYRLQSAVDIITWVVENGKKLADWNTHPT